MFLDLDGFPPAPSPPPPKKNILFDNNRQMCLKEGITGNEKRKGVLD